MIARLSTTITRIKTLVFTKFPLRLLWYTAVVLLLLSLLGVLNSYLFLMRGLSIALFARLFG